MSADNTMGAKSEGRRARRAAAKTRDEVTQEVTEEGERALSKAKARPTPTRRAKEEDEAPKGFFARIITDLRDYVEGVSSEVRKVVWPSNEDVRRLTQIVLTTLVATSIALGIIVLLFTELFRVGLNQPIILLAIMALAGIVGIVYSRISSQRSSS